MPKNLTAAAVAKLRPGRSRTEIRDGGAPGLSLVIQPTGVKSWAMRFRRPNGRSAKLTLGLVDLSGKEATGEATIGAPLSLAAARSLAAEVHRERARGLDVVAKYHAEKRRRSAEITSKLANTFAAAAQSFVEDHARPKTRRWRETARLLGLSYPHDGGDPTEIKGGLTDRWRDKPVAEIDGHDIYSVIDETRRLGAPGLRRRNDGASDPRGRSMARTLSKMFSWLVEHRRITTNPCTGVFCPPAPPPRDRVLTDAEIRSFWSGCEAIDEPYGPLFKLLLLTGARREEVARMTRDELTDGGPWNLPGHRTKNKRPHVVPLPPLAREIIASVKQIEGRPGYVFTTNGRTPVSGFSKIKRRLDSEMSAAATKNRRDDAAIPPWRLHDLRRTAATGMAELGIAPHIVEAALNHVSGAKAGVAGTYNRAAYAEEKRAALERWAAHIQGLVTGRPAVVLALRKRRKT